MLGKVELYAVLVSFIRSACKLNFLSFKSEVLTIIIALLLFFYHDFIYLWSVVIFYWKIIFSSDFLN